MNSSSWITRNIKMHSQNEYRTATARILITSNLNNWTIKLTAFWTSPMVGDLYIIGDNAKKVFPITTKGGAFEMSQTVSGVIWNPIIGNARALVIISGKKIILKADMPLAKTLENDVILDLVSQKVDKAKSELIVAKSTSFELPNKAPIIDTLITQTSPNENIPLRKITPLSELLNDSQNDETQLEQRNNIDSILANNPLEDSIKTVKETRNQPISEPTLPDLNQSKDTITPNVEEVPRANRIMDENEVKQILSRSPIDRIIPPIKELKLSNEPAKPIAFLPMNWGKDEIKDALDNPPIDPPFAGRFRNSKFVIVHLNDAVGFNHMLVGSVPLGKVVIYMLCIPGKSTTPHAGLLDYKRWIPSTKGNGYWVKYIT